MTLSTLLRRSVKLIKNPEYYLSKKARFTYQRKILARLLPSTLACDEFYQKYTYKRFFGYDLDLNSPRTYNEKIRWYNLYDRNSLYTQLADKFLVNDYVKKIIGTRYIKQIYGVYNSSWEINWDELPNRFVIKMSHGSHWNIICEDKTELDIKIVIKTLNKWINTNFYHMHREWQYKDIKPRIIIEEYLESNHELGLLEFNSYCFNGVPKFIEVNMELNSIKYRVYFDNEWRKQQLVVRYPLPIMEVTKPKCSDELLCIASRLANNIPFCRVDLFVCSGKIYFGEMTLTPGAGYIVFNPSNYDRVFGDLMELRKYAGA